MSNEFKDWYNDLTDTQKKIYNITKEYPFLTPEDENYFYDYLDLEIPKGWYKLFFQMCGDIKPILEREDLMDKFRFVQVKEKFGEMICYTNKYSAKEIDDIIVKYQYISSRICNNCGKPATCTTAGYILPYCHDCWKDHVRHFPIECVEFDPDIKIVKFTKDGYTKRVISCKEEWNRCLKENGYDMV